MINNYNITRGPLCTVYCCNLCKYDLPFYVAFKRDRNTTAKSNSATKAINKHIKEVHNHEH